MPGFLYVLGTDGALWHEANNYHTTGQRTLVDTNVKAFDPDPSTPGFLYVLGTDGALWHEANNYHTTGRRTLVDTSVQAFDPDPSTPGFLYVLGTDGGLWHEANNYHTTGQRTLVDTSVKAFAPDPTTSGFLYVLGTDGGLWHEANNYHTTGQRTLVDTSVKAFAPDPTTSGFLYVLETDGDLWFEFSNYQTTKQHSLVDTSVQALPPTPQRPAPGLPKTRRRPRPTLRPPPALCFSTPACRPIPTWNKEPWVTAGAGEPGGGGGARDPNDIESMFTKDGSSTVDGSEVGYYTVRFFNNNGSPVYVQVDTQFPSAGQEYDQVVNVLGTKALWVALAEKAYAEAGYLGYVNIPLLLGLLHSAGRPGRRRRSSSWAPTLSPASPPATTASIPRTSPEPGTQASSSCSAPTPSPETPTSVGGHAYAVVGYNPWLGEPFEVFNPWGVDSLVPLGSSYWMAPGNTVFGLSSLPRPACRRTSPIRPSAAGRLM